MPNKYNIPLDYFTFMAPPEGERSTYILSDSEESLLGVALLERLEALVDVVDSLSQSWHLKELTVEVGQNAIITDECRRGECSYYNDYLVFATPGEPNLDHLSYHCVERRYHQAQERLQAWCDEHPNVLPLDDKEGTVLLSLAQEWAKKIRA